MRKSLFAAGVLVLILGIAYLASTCFDKSWPLRQLMNEQGLTAASIAFGKVGEAPELWAINTSTDRTFPYYSLSKPITAAAVLAERDLARLHLDDRVAGASVAQLLQHTGGWDRDMAGDPVINRTTQEACTDLPAPPKQFRPGRRYAYSNIGYCLLGKHVADRTGLTYEAAVRRDIPETRAMKFDPWLGPAGGWSGTAATYFRFATRPVPRGTTAAPVPTPKDPPYGLGWFVGPDGQLSHFGWLRHNFAVVVRQDDFVAVALFDGMPNDIDTTKIAMRKQLLALR